MPGEEKAKKQEMGVVVALCSSIWWQVPNGQKTTEFPVQQ
jgi:hypothetical protein